MILLIDNYDSFAYNLYQLVGSLAPGVRVVRNDALGVEEVLALAPQAVVLSPGPGRPADAGICEELVRRAAGVVPILGVCLGHQAICEALGGRVGYARTLMHGKSSLVSVGPDSLLFAGLPPRVEVARYHSLAAEEATLPPTLRVTARSDDGEVMAVEGVGAGAAPLCGVQFHPESVLTPDGAAMVRNFLAAAGIAAAPGSVASVFGAGGGSALAPAPAPAPAAGVP